MKKIIAGVAALTALVLAGCGGAAKTAASPAPVQQAANKGLSMDGLKIQAHALTAKLGCPTAIVVSGPGYAEGAAYVSLCTVNAGTQNEIQYSVIVVFPNATMRDAYVTGVGGLFVKGQAKGGYFAIGCFSTDDLQHVVNVTGGQIA